MQSEYPYPACGFLVFNEPSGSYDICPICDWEDDHVQLRFPWMKGGANKKSLREHQSTSVLKLPQDVMEYRGFSRDRAWRPLRSDEALPDKDSRQIVQGYFEAASRASPSYYWLED